MKPHPRIRKTVKWGSTAITVLLLVVLIGSVWRYEYFQLWSHGSAEVCGGGVIFEWTEMTPTDMPGHVWITRRFGDEPFQWWFRSRTYIMPPRVTEVNIPLWPFVAVAAGFTLLLWRRDRLRPHAHQCPTCNYDRTGLARGAGAVCPECGSPA